MLSNMKLKVRQPKDKDEGPNRRIRTEVNENNKKISFYLNKSKQPLLENKRALNQSELPSKKTVRPIKSISIKNNAPMPTKLITEPHERQPLPFAQRQAMEKLFGPAKKEPFNNNSFQKPKETKDSSRMHGAGRYLFEDKVGSGTFGVVHKARDKITLETVAIKKVFQDKKYKNRELQILKALNHPNVLKMRDSFYTYENEKEYLNVVMDFYPSNLYDSLQRHRNKPEMPRLKLKLFAYQMFRGLLYLKSIQIAHRDIKPHNILVNEANCNLLICDFGSAKKLQADQPNLAYICSRCYRAPELIFGSTGYTTQIDMWSAGCILVEMVTLQPLFRSDSNIDQLVEIIRVLGTPSYEQIMEMNPDCDIEKYKFPKINPRPWEKVIKRKNFQDFYDLVEKVLRYSPERRLDPYEALCHSYFDELRSRETYMKLKREFSIGDLFDFGSTKELTASQSAILVPKWYS